MNSKVDFPRTSENRINSKMDFSPILDFRFRMFIRISYLNTSSCTQSLVAGRVAYVVGCENAIQGALAMEEILPRRARSSRRNAPHHFCCTRKNSLSIQPRRAASTCPPPPLATGRQLALQQNCLQLYSVQSTYTTEFGHK